MGQGWGNIVLIKHKLLDGIVLFSQYAHLNRIYKWNGNVSRREKIGTIGKGYNNEYYAHLHFELRKANMEGYSAGYWPASHSKTTQWILDHYYNPSNRYNDWYNNTGFIESHRPTKSGYASVAAGVEITPSILNAGDNFEVSFTLHEVNGSPITFTEVTCAILDINNNHLFDLAKFSNVTISANGDWIYRAKGYLNNAGTYKAVARGRVNNWFDFTITGNGINPISFNIVENDNYAQLPYQTGFESGVLDKYWSKSSSNIYGRIQLTSTNLPHSGNKHLTMDVNTNNHYCTNQANLNLDLSGNNNVTLSFWHKEFRDENNMLDGIYFSDDGGANFIKVHNLIGNNGNW